MSATDFNKTAAMFRSEIEAGIDDLHRELSASQGQSDKGSSSLLSALLIAFVLIGQFLFMYWFDVPHPKPIAGSVAAPAGTQSFAKSERDKKILSGLMTRVDEGVDGVETTKLRVAPNMQIEGYLMGIRSAVRDTKAMLGIEPPAVTDEEKRPRIPPPGGASQIK